MEEPATYVLSGAIPVQDDVDGDQLRRVTKHLGRVATVHLKLDKVARAVTLRISGVLMRDDVRHIEQRIESGLNNSFSASAGSRCQCGSREAV